METFITVSRIFDNEDDIFIFSGNFENPAQVVKTSCKRNINLKNIMKYQLFKYHYKVKQL